VSDTKERIVTATAELFRRQGYNGTPLKQVTVAASAPFGSLYHFFPGGKEELGEVVVRSSGQAYLELFELIADAAQDMGTAVTDFFDGAADVLEQTGYLDACPIGTVALEVASTNDRLRQATADVFAGWIDAVRGRFESAGARPERARELATALVAGVEGGFMLSRAAQRAEPLRTTGRLLRELVEAELRLASSAPRRVGAASH